MQTIDRAFAVLRALASQSGTSALADISRATNLPKSTTLRILGALEDLRMVDRIGGRYAIGSGLATLTHQATPVSSLQELCRPYLMALANDLGENASLAMADGNQVLYIDTIPAPGVVQVQDWTGEHVPFHGSAAGLALMSRWTSAAVDEYADAGLEILTAATVSTKTELRRRMKQIRTAGFAWTRTEFNDEVNGIAAAIVPADGDAIGALSVFGPTFRFPGEQESEHIEGALLDACEQISRRF